MCTKVIDQRSNPAGLKEDNINEYEHYNYLFGKYSFDKGFSVPQMCVFES